MEATPINALPFPDDEDAPDGPVQIGGLAAALDVLKWGSHNLKPSVGVIAASEALVLGVAYADIPGAVVEITPAVASTMLVIASFDLEVITGTVLRTITGTVRLDAADQTPAAVFKSAQTGALAAVTQVYSLPLTAAKHTIKLRGKSDVAANGRVSTNTRALYAVFAS